MRTTAVAAAFLFALVAATPQRLASQGIRGIAKKAAEAAKQQDDKKKARDADKDKSSEPAPTTCDVSDDAYERLLKGLQAEREKRQQMKDERDKDRQSGREYKKCQSDWSSSAEYKKIMSQNAPGPNATAASITSTVTKNAADAQKAMEKKCGGKDPMENWTNELYADLLDKIGAAAARVAGMDQKCYAELKEYADFFCNSLTQAQQEKAATQGIKYPGSGSVFWIFTPEHAAAIKPRCSKLVPALDDLERATAR